MKTTPADTGKQTGLQSISDNQGIGDKIMSMIRFAEDCVDDRRYQEANEIYEWLWQMSVSTDSEYEDYVDLEMLEENNLIHTDMKHLALLTLYADYQVLPAKERARDIYLYFFQQCIYKITFGRNVPCRKRRAGGNRTVLGRLD